MAGPEFDDGEIEDGEIENQVDDAEADGEGSGFEAEDPAVDPGAEQETGDSEDVGAPQSRGSGRFQRLANENNELRQRLLDLERRGGSPQPTVVQPQEETDEQFNQRMALLSIDERIEARQARSERRFSAQLNAMRVHTEITQDKLAYDAKAASDARYKRYADDVEALHAKLLRENGQLVPRQVLLEVVIGRRVLANAGTKEVKRQKQASSQRVAKQVARPTGGRSDVANAGRRETSEAAARAKRLENQLI
jgi:hypothetical protein